MCSSFRFCLDWWSGLVQILFFLFFALFDCRVFIHARRLQVHTTKADRNTDIGYTVNNYKYRIDQSEWRRRRKTIKETFFFFFCSAVNLNHYYCWRIFFSYLTPSLSYGVRLCVGSDRVHCTIVHNFNCNGCLQFFVFLSASDVPPPAPPPHPLLPHLSGITGLSFDSIFLPALLLFYLVLLLPLPSPFSAFGPVPCLLSRNVFTFCSLETGYFVLPLFLVVFVCFLDVFFF